jgi:transcription-repair coupling factor (superfamily II helicase)
VQEPASSFAASGCAKVLDHASHQLRAARRAAWPHVWSEVDRSAQAFALALLLRQHRGTVCLIAPDARTQEELGDELLSWIPGGRVFPDLARAVVENALPDPEILAERVDLLRQLQAENPAPWVLFHQAQLEENVTDPSLLRRTMLALQEGQDLGSAGLESLLSRLSDWGYERVSQVFGRGEFSVRGGIVDVFSWHRHLPVRLEFFDTTLESIREFSTDGQTSIRALGTTEILPPADSKQNTPLAGLLQDLPRILIESAPENSTVPPPEQPFVTSALLPDEPSPFPFHPCPEAAFPSGDFVLHTARREAFLHRLRQWLSDRWQVAVFCDNEGEWERLGELLAEGGLSTDSLLPCRGSQTRSFLSPALQLAVLTESDLFGRTNSRRIRRLAQRHDGLVATRATGDLSEFVEGDFVVHLEHGIARYLGLQRLPGEEHETLALEFAREARLYVPLDQAWQISRYVGLGKKHPDLSELGSEKWEKAKSKTQDAVFRYARQMLSLQAERETTTGFACPPDHTWQREFEDSFPFTETPDQARAILETKHDMESARPMDRLICGDVGFGKTEVAIRAAFKAVMGGKQVAFLAPTTVLAQQHYETLRERMSEYPVRIEILSRYRTAAQQRKTLAALAQGEVDIVVGTHRLTSSDVHWKNLGLLIVDEEQRFGVKQKDLLKERFRLVDVLTLSATPIPRTLYMALMGARDMSVIDTPPPNRQPVETVICGYDERLIRDAIRRELERGGQVYLLHNRVATIDKLAQRVRDLVPRARVETGHGQMAEGELEDVMHRFVAGETDVLVSTTIIESGLDIPNANTIIIDRADLFGLADLYQLRGRVGRAGHKAFAYLLLPRQLLMVGEARKRISAIKQYSQLGAGFQIAMRDLEIRGAGNLLGTAQSGHIVAIGFDLYCKLLRTAVKKLSGEASSIRQQCNLRLDFVQWSEGSVTPDASTAPAYLPASYITDPALRVAAYRKFSEAENPAALQNLESEWRDRFGPLPPAAHHLLLTGHIRFAAGERSISLLEVKENKLMLTRRGDYLLINNRFPRLQSPTPTQRLPEILHTIQSLFK